MDPITTPPLGALLIYGLWEIVKIFMTKKLSAEKAGHCLERIRAENRSMMSTDEHDRFIESCCANEACREDTAECVKIARKIHEEILEVKARL